MQETQFHSSGFVLHTFGDYAKFLRQGTKLQGTVFWDRTPCSLVHIYRHFGRTCCIYLQDLQNIGSTQHQIPKERSLHVRELRDAGLALTGVGVVQDVAAKDS
jgi:hypothetical protein